MFCRTLHTPGEIGDDRFLVGDKIVLSEVLLACRLDVVVVAVSLGAGLPFLVRYGRLIVDL